MFVYYQIFPFKEESSQFFLSFIQLLQGFYVVFEPFTGIFDVKNGTLTSDAYEIDLKKSAGADLDFLTNEYKGTYTPDSGDSNISFTVEDIGTHGDIQAIFEYEPQEGKKCSFISKFW